MGKRDHARLNALLARKYARGGNPANRRRFSKAPEVTAVQQRPAAVAAKKAEDVARTRAQVERIADHASDSVRADEWNEADHPRKPNGEFGSGAHAQAGKSSVEKPWARNGGGVTLYRATQPTESDVHPWSAWTPEPETAAAYTENQGFGGPHIRQVRMNLKEPDILDFDTGSRAGMRELATHLGYEDPEETGDQWFDAGWRYPWEESKDVKRRLLASPYKALRYEDDFPQGAQTIVPFKPMGPEDYEEEASSRSATSDSVLRNGSVRSDAAAKPLRAAGILFQDKDDRVLLLRRAADDHAGEWALPGGKIDGDETAKEAARRELREECEANFEGELEEFTRRVKDGVDFTTFRAKVEPFDVRLNAEHDRAVWIDPQTALEHLPLHPGVRVVLERLSMTELDVAEAIRDGELASPQKFANIWLFAIRVTGTGKSYRPVLNEHVWRPPEFYLNDEFLARCSGVPVVWDHPPPKDDGNPDDKAGTTLDTKEFHKRTVGVTCCPWLKLEVGEVWCVGKIYDEGAAKLLQKDQLSTSPTVVFIGADNGEKHETPDGEHLLIEGRPSYLESVALCELGVWDVNHKPEGVDSISVAADRADASNMDRLLGLIVNSQITLLSRRAAAR